MRTRLNNLFFNFLYYNDKLEYKTNLKQEEGLDQ